MLGRDDDLLPMAPGAASLIVHASTVAVAGRAVLIRGASGSGKSAMALQLLALGAGLIADDRTVLTRAAGQLIADAPPILHGLIEARGVGILNCPAVGPAPLALIVDMDRPEHERLPGWHQETVLDVTLPVLGNPDAPHFPSAILLYLKNGRHG